MTSVAREAAPIRIQRRRTKGFNLQAQSPDGRPVVSVCRPGKWGNAFVIVRNYEQYDVVSSFNSYYGSYADKEQATAAAVREYKGWVEQKVIDGKLDLAELRGKHLACFCPVGAALCHADILLEIANTPTHPLPIQKEAAIGGQDITPKSS